MNNIIYGLSDNDYHFSEPYREYLSSSALKHYLKSPKYAKFAIDNPIKEDTYAFKLGSLLHSYMECAAKYSTDTTSAEHEWLKSIAVFYPPINKNKGKPYGITTKVYNAALDAFMQANQGKTIVNSDVLSQVQAMSNSIIYACGCTSEQIRKLLKWGEPEVSFFYEIEEGIKLKVRPDLLTRKKIIDFKSTKSIDLKENEINNIIITYGYQISSSMYQYVIHEITGEWLDFILVFISNVPPYDCVMVNMSNYGYKYLPEYDMVVPGPGAIEFKKLLDLHIKCMKENEWPGAETFIQPDNGVRVLEIQPPTYYSNRFVDDY